MNESFDSIGDLVGDLRGIQRVNSKITACNTENDPCRVAEAGKRASEMWHVLLAGEFAFEKNAGPIAAFSTLI